MIGSVGCGAAKITAGHCAEFTNGRMYQQAIAALLREKEQVLGKF
jgi:hypothetical protein